MRTRLLIPIWGAAAVSVALAGCGSESGRERPAVGRSTGNIAQPPSHWREHVDERRGFSVSFPRGWHRARRSPTIGDPVEILSVATFAFSRNRGLCRSLAAVPPDQALVNLMERGRGAYGGPSFPARPLKFMPDPELPGTSTWRHCAGGEQPGPAPVLDYWFGFGDVGRAFHVMVALGKAARPAVRRQAFRILDTLRFDPDVKPHWRSVG